MHLRLAQKAVRRVAVLLVLASSCLAGVGCQARDATGPLTGIKLYVDPYSAAAVAAAAMRRHDPARADLLQKIADQPQSTWFGDWNPLATVTADVAASVTAAAKVHAVPVLVAYNMVRRDCGSYSAGGAADANAYRSWITAFAAGINQSPAVVIVEPDALSQLTCLTPDEQATRLDLLKFAVKTLHAYPTTIVYVDAGNSTWVPAKDMAIRLKSVDIGLARGFSLNVSGFNRTQDEVNYGKAVSALVGGKHFVVDTSRNGLGPTSGTESWCNPPGRALGVPPLTPPKNDLVDALLWIKTPGNSDGTCGRREPAAGTFWADYAVGLVQRAQQ
jgi:endoglucanase